MKKVLIIVLSVFLGIGLLMGGFVLFVTWGLQNGQSLQVNSISVSELADGTYAGHYDGGRWSNDVAVEVKDHKITNINFTKDVTFSKPEVRTELIEEVLQKQDCVVDVVSSSTVTCKAYMKAIEIALTKK